MRIWACTGVAIGVLAVCGVNVAGGAPKRHLVGQVTRPVVTDGSRYALMQQGPLSMRLVDTRSGRRRAVPLPDSPQCSSASGHRGLFLVNCMIEGTDSERPYLLHARTDTLVPVIGDGQKWDPRVDHFSIVGTHWLQGVNSEDRPIDEYLNWHTGERRYGESQDFPRQHRDLDSPDLRPVGSPNDDAAFQIAGPYTLTTAPSGFGPLLLHKRGAATIRVDRCDSFCSSATMGGGWVTWTTSFFARAYSIASRVRLTWRFPAPIPEVQHTSSAIFFSVPIYAAAHLTGYRVYEASLPRHPAKAKIRR